jgi:hypothetical protein
MLNAYRKRKIADVNVNMNIPPGDGAPLLWGAISCGEVDTLEFLLRWSLINPKSLSNSEEYVSKIYSVIDKHITLNQRKCIGLLIDDGRWDPDVWDESPGSYGDENALIRATKAGLEDIVELLLKHPKVDPAKYLWYCNRNCSGGSIVYACDEGQWKIATRLALDGRAVDLGLDRETLSDRNGHFEYTKEDEEEVKKFIRILVRHPFFCVNNMEEAKEHRLYPFILSVFGEDCSEGVILAGIREQQKTLVN